MKNLVDKLHITAIITSTIAGIGLCILAVIFIYEVKENGLKSIVTTIWEGK